MRRPIGLLLLTLLLVFAARAHAEDIASARAHFQKGKVLYDLQRYIQAAHEYELAYEAKDDPALLYNIGQSYRLANEPQKALGAYRAYLRNVSNPPNGAEVDTRIAELQRLVDEQQRTREAQPAGTLPAKEPLPESAAANTRATPTDNGSPRNLRLAGIITGAVGVAALAAGIALEVIAQQDNNKLTNPPAGAVFDPSLESAVKVDHPTGIALICVGGAALAAGATLLVLGMRHGRAAQANLAPFIARDGGGVAWSGSF